MATAYTIGLLAGLGTALGVLAAALLAGLGRAALTAALAAAAVAAPLGYLLFEWPQAAAGAVGGLLGGAGAAPFVTGTLRRGGTRGGTTVLVGVAALGLAVLALVPVVGYLEALGVPALATRLRRRSPETYAGLRTLVRD